MKNTYLTNKGQETTGRLPHQTASGVAFRADMAFEDSFGQT